jgi:phosphonate transport system permease protein
MHANRSIDFAPPARLAAVPGRAPAQPDAAPRQDARPAADLTWSRFRFPHSLFKYAALLAGLALVAYAVDYLDIDLERLPGMLGRMGATLSQRYFPPNLEHILQRDYLTAVVQTLEMSYLATVLGIAIAIPLAWFAAHNMTPSRRFLYPLARLAITGARSVHEMIWTILLVAILGFGMLPGTLALILFCIGFAGKLFAEAIEGIDRGQVEAVRATGASHLQVFVYAVLPQVRVAWTGISIYTWDAVFRAATIVGFFGAGGMGWYLRESVQLIASRDVAAILLSIIAVVVVLELVSAWLRGWVAKAVA